MKKKVIGPIIGIILVIILLLGFFVCKEFGDYTNIIKLNRGIEIPKEASVKEIYSKDSGASFHGDGVRYHVYSYENEAVVDSMLNRTKPNSDIIVPTAYYDSYMEAIINRLIDLDISDEYAVSITDFEKFYYQKQDDNSEIIIIKGKSKRLYVIESFL